MPHEEHIDTGDTVRHRPTGEIWVVACVQSDRLSWMGWPEGMAALSDCDLVKKATPERRLCWLREMARSRGNDHRVRYARRILSEMEGD